MPDATMPTPDEADKFFKNELEVFSGPVQPVAIDEKDGAFQPEHEARRGIFARNLLGNLVLVAHSHPDRLDAEVQTLFNAFVLHSSSLNRNDASDSAITSTGSDGKQAPIVELNKLMMDTRSGTVMYSGDFSKRVKQGKLVNMTNSDFNTVTVALSKPQNILMPCMEPLYEVPKDVQGGFEGWLNLNWFVAKTMAELGDPGALYARLLSEVLEEQSGPRLHAKGARAAQSLEYRLPAFRIWNKLVGPLLFKEITWMNPQQQHLSSGAEPGPLAQADGITEPDITIKRYDFWLNRLTKVLDLVEEEAKMNSSLQETVTQGRYLLEEMRFEWPDGMDDEKIKAKRAQGLEEAKAMQTFQVDHAAQREQKSGGCCVIL